MVSANKRYDFVITGYISIDVKGIDMTGVMCLADHLTTPTFFLEHSVITSKLVSNVPLTA